MPLFAIGGFALMSAGGLVVEPNASPAEIVSALDQGIRWPARLGLYLDLLGSLLLLVFAARVASTVRPAHGSPSLLPTLVVGFAVLAVAASFIDKSAFHVIAARAGEGLSPASAVLLVDLITASFLLFQATFAAFVVSAALGVRQAGIGPRWLGAGGVLIGLASLVAVAFPGTDASQLPFPFMVIWVVALSVVLIRFADSGRSTAGHELSAPGHSG